MNVLAGLGRVLFVHAHPDDETLFTGALISHLSSSGVETVVLTATRGEEGAVRPGPLSGLAGTPILAIRRERELAAALQKLGVSRSCFLGMPPARAAGLAERRYRDSGMRWITPGLAGPAESPAHDQALTAADLDQVAGDIAAYINYVQPDVVITYDADGGYGHPDHVRVRAATEAAVIQTRVPLAEVLLKRKSDGEWFDLEDEFPIVVSALSCHATQLVVEGREVVHAGAQREPIVTSVGLRLIGG